MFDTIFSKLHAHEIAYRDDIISTRRKFMRHDGADAEVMVAGRPYDIRDWSMGGVLFDTPKPDSRNMGGAFYEEFAVPDLQPGDHIRTALRFHILDETVEIPVEAEILRRGSHGTVARYKPYGTATRKLFERVLDLKYAANFLQSQKKRKA